MSGEAPAERATQSAARGEAPPRRGASVPGREWALLGAGLILAGAGFLYRGSPRAGGTLVWADLTLVPDDANRLACASAHDFSGFRCAHGPDGARVPELARPLVPAVTTGRELYFVAGLFQDPDLARHLASARARPNERFTVRCQLRLIERTRELRVRFHLDTPFAPAEPGWVADAVSCHLPSKP
ncbi:MAG: hypothetical protein IT376_09075 [Polyangiaceae bacterium]|nr:hypothetical protein [Polyangiaceae bacterium]